MYARTRRSLKDINLVNVPTRHDHVEFVDLAEPFQLTSQVIVDHYCQVPAHLVQYPLMAIFRMFSPTRHNRC